MQDMNEIDVMAFLQEGTRTGKVATVQENGRPHVVPIWFVLDGEDLLFTTWHTSVKARNMERNGRVAICVDNENPPYDFVMLEGSVTFIDDLAAIRKWATVIGGRYMGADKAEAFGERNGVAGELLVRVQIDKIAAKKEMAA